VENNVIFWRDLMVEASGRIDYCTETPALEPLFLSVWAEHYHKISTIAKPGADFLEIGTGFGVLATGIARLSGKKGVSVEHPSRKYFFSASYLDFLMSNSISMVGCDLKEGLPFHDNCFSLIYLCDVIEHLFFVDIKILLTEVFRVLRLGGELVISTPNLNRLGNVVRMMKGYSPNPPLYAESCGETYGHIREFAPKELASLLQRHGLVPTKRAFCLNPFFTAHAFGEENIFSERGASRINSLSKLLFKIFPWLADEIYLVAEKRVIECQ